MENPVKVRKTIKAQDLKRNAPDVVVNTAQGGTCPAMRKECYRCGKANHFASKCRSNPPKVHTVNESVTESDTDSDRGEHFYIGEISASCKQDEVFVPIKRSTGSKAKSCQFQDGYGGTSKCFAIEALQKIRFFQLYS